MNTSEKKIPLWTCLAILGFFAAAFILQVVLWGSPNVHMTLIFSSAFAAILLMLQGVPFSKIEEGIIHGNKIATVSMMILMFVGVMIPAWIGAGTIPALIYYGLKIISPSIFLAACVFICAVSCLATGTSWGTFGILIPIVVDVFSGTNHELMIISISACMAGAVCGDHCSPISDTTIMASAGAQCEHVNHVSTQLPYAMVAAVVSFLTYIVAGFVQTAWIALPVGIVFMMIALIIIRVKFDDLKM